MGPTELKQISGWHMDFLNKREDLKKQVDKKFKYGLRLREEAASAAGKSPDMAPWVILQRGQGQDKLGVICAKIELDLIPVGLQHDNQLTVRFANGRVIKQSTDSQHGLSVLSGDTVASLQEFAREELPGVKVNTALNTHFRADSDSYDEFCKIHDEAQSHISSVNMSFGQIAAAIRAVTK